MWSYTKIHLSDNVITLYSGSGTLNVVDMHNNVVLFSEYGTHFISHSEFYQDWLAFDMLICPCHDCYSVLALAIICSWPVCAGMMAA